MQCTFIVSGLVQQVFYRKHTVAKALALGLHGYVMNQNDGSVKIVVSGSADAIKKLHSWCYIGSPLSKVTDVQQFNNHETISEPTFIQL
jgi:acylphosphatase